MKKKWYNIYMECTKESAEVTARLGDVICIGKIRSYGLAYVACKAIQEAVKGNYKVYCK